MRAVSREVTAAGAPTAVASPVSTQADPGAARDGERPGVPWLTLAEGGQGGSAPPDVRTGRVLLQVGTAAAVVIVLVCAVSVVLARMTAEREAINRAVQVTDVLAESVVQAALDDDLLSGNSEAALARLDAAVGQQVLSADLVRVKLWSVEGEIVYSDESRLIGRVYGLGADEREVLANPRIEAEVTDLSEPENEFERGQGKLLEVYRPVWTPGGQPLLFETYTRYATVTSRTAELWRGLTGILVSSLLLLVVLLAPVLWALLDRLHRARLQREALLQHAVDASGQERQRIAATLHDGIVQELVGTSYALAAAAEQAQAGGQRPLSERLEAAGDAVRASIGGLRSLLVDIYPPSLRASGLATALQDLAATVRSRNVDLRLDVDGLPPGGTGDAASEELAFRVAQECLRNAVAHSRASSIRLRATVEGATLEGGNLVLEISDDGTGFDVHDVTTTAEEGHFGLRILPDLARQRGATLLLATAPGAGTRWRLVAPLVRTGGAA